MIIGNEMVAINIIIIIIIIVIIIIIIIIVIIIIIIIIIIIMTTCPRFDSQPASSGFRSGSMMTCERGMPVAVETRRDDDVVAS
jgi:hypothetical protein